MNATGVVIALAAAGLFTVAGCASESTKVAGTGHCNGVNACKGQSACKTAKSACKGQNACKGQGFMVMTKADCAAAGGQFQSDGGGY
ncbi:MAG: BufA2 family periplasmic bufferin-type metallophore [Burkholderiales bacterium]